MHCFMKKEYWFILAHFYCVVLLSEFFIGTLLRHVHTVYFAKCRFLLSMNNIDSRPNDATYIICFIVIYLNWIWFNWIMIFRYVFIYRIHICLMSEFANDNAYSSLRMRNKQQNKLFCYWKNYANSERHLLSKLIFQGTR